MSKSISVFMRMMSLDDEISVRRAQLRSLTKQLPLMYIAVSLNAVAMGWNHTGVAPFWLSLPPPLLMVPLCLVRAWQWRHMPVDTFDDRQVAHVLRRTVFFVAVLGAGFSGWGHGLLTYGTIFDKLGVVFVMSYTTVGCLFCLMQLRPAALLVAAITIAPLLVHLMSIGSTGMLAIFFNLSLISCIIVLMILAYYEDFRHEVHTAERLATLGDAHRVAAETDLLTGLANRRRFFEELVHDIASPDARFAIGLIDLDGFKLVNDRFGHAAGDVVLAETAQRFRQGFTEDATIARLGGDEFGLIVRGAALDDLAGLGARIAAAASQPITIPNESGAVHVGASLGFAVFPAMGRTQVELLERADCALYHAKNHCRGAAVVFSDDHADEARERRRVEEELGRADLETELSLCFQPIVDVASGRTVAFEALARWTNPRLGPISPAVFIPIAERLGLVRDLTTILFRKACRAAAAWPEDIQLSFNLSVHDLFGDEPLERLTRLIGESGLPSRRIIVEVTEGVTMHDFEAGSRVLQGLRALGCQIALDDFGTGYSSLSYVHRLPLDRLKIDQSFVRSMTSDRTSRAIVQSILGLSATLGVQCVVEGVETDTERSLLEGMGVRWMQGYHFGRPMTEAAALAHLAEASLGTLTSFLAELDREAVPDAA